MDNIDQIIKEIEHAAGFIIVPKILFTKYPSTTSLLLSYLINLYQYVKLTDNLVEEEWFFSPLKAMCEKVGLTRKYCENAINTLKEDGIIKTKTNKFNKRYFSINFILLQSMTKQLKKENDEKIKQYKIENSLSFIEEDKVNSNIDRARSDTLSNNISINNKGKDILSKDNISLVPSAQMKDTDKSTCKEIPSSILTFIEYWEKVGLTKHGRNTATFTNAVSLLQKLINGTLFNKMGGFESYKNRKFTFDEFKIAIDNYYQALTNPQYKPSNKCKIKTSLPNFLLNMFSNNMYTTSLFIHYLENQPQPLCNIVDKHPQLTAEIEAIYKDQVLGNSTSKITFYDKQKFVAAAEQLHDFIVRNKKRINSLFINTERKKAEILWRAIKNDVKDSMIITSGFFSSATTFCKRLPAYMYAQNVISVEEKQPINNIYAR